MAMSDDTYYTVLHVPETASLSEIKTAYRDLIRQVHPDTISNLAPYLKSIAEEKAKEITEAYSVLSSSSKRREYDAQLAVYRRQASTPTPPPPPTQQAASQSSSGPYCNRCGTPLNASGFCAKCTKFTAAAATVQKNWALLKRTSQEHPILAVVILLFFVWLVATAVSNNDSSRQIPAQLPPEASIGKDAVPATAPHNVISEEPQPATPTVSVSGIYVGTVRNQTANLSSSFAVVLHQTQAGLVEGCMDVKPPLFGRGALRGSMRGTHLNFAVADLVFQGDVSKNQITGSYVVSRTDGNQLGNFRLTKQKSSEATYLCTDGVLTEAATAAPPPSSSPWFADGSSHQQKVRPPAAKLHSPQHATVIGNYALYKRCAFLPYDNYARCNWGPKEVADLKRGDRVTVLSSLTRAENGDDIYKVRTEQGWVGWISSQGVTLDPQ